MQRAIPPDSSHAGLPACESAGQREAIGDLHYAADNFVGAVEEFSAALKMVGEPGERARLLVRIAACHFQRSDIQASLEALTQARALARGLRDSRLNARIATYLSKTVLEFGQYRRSRRLGLYAYSVLRNTDDHATIGVVGTHLGAVCGLLGRNTEAIEWLQDAIATFRRIDDAEGLVGALSNLAVIYKNLREWREATRLLEQALKIDERAGLYARMRLHNQVLGLIRYRLGHWDLADENFVQALKISRDVGNAQGEAQVLLALGMLGRRRRQFDRAVAHFQRALELAEKIGAVRESLLAREFLAEVDLDRGNPQAALRLLEPALEESKSQAPEGNMTAELEIRLGIALLDLGRLDESREHLLHGATLFARIGDRLEEAIAGRALARLEAARGDADAMEIKVRAAAQCFDQLGEIYELAVTLGAWGESLLLLPARSRMRVALEPVGEALRRSAALFRQLGVLPRAAESLLTFARLEAEREHYDHALSLLEQAEQWLHESSDAETEDRAAALRRELEQQYVAVSLSTCNEFRALDDANRLFRDASDMDGLLAQTVKLAVENAGGDRGFVAFSSGGGRLEVVAHHGLGRDRGRRILTVLEGVIGDRIAESGPLFSTRVAADPRFGAALGGALEGVGSLVCVPLSFPSQSVGIVYVDRFTENLLGAFKQRELNLLAVLANSAAVAIVEAQRSLLLAENRVLRERLKPNPGLERVVSRSREMEDILHLLAKVGDSSASLLFMGETGTGKGLLAQAVHEISNRRERSFVQVNCAALPEQLLESELFGYVHGAFTGATRDKTGLFEEAEGGTIFLDEIEKVPETVQAKLLHVLDRGEIRPVGATRSKRVDARVICATGCDLRERIAAGRFLEDLYYRLNDITVRVPSLRERREDIAVLAQHFLAVFSRQMEKPLKGFEPEVMQAFLRHEWRGNVRELEKTVKRMVVLADEGDALGLALLPHEMLEGAPAPEPTRVNGQTLRLNVAALERRMIAEALDRNRWNKARAARELGLSYPTLLAKIRGHRIERQAVR